MKNTVVIPARYNSSRFPGKLLSYIGDKTIIQLVYEQACKADLVSDVIVATDDERIYEAATSFGVRVIMTKSNHYSGTSRIVEVAQKVKSDIYINVQGDEPFIEPSNIDDVILILKNNMNAHISTLYHHIDEKEAVNENNVKVIMNSLGRAIYFSRSLIPFYRNSLESNKLYYKHVGLYAYHRRVLLDHPNLDHFTQLEKIEKLEQLRYLEAGYNIYLKNTNNVHPSIDTYEDLQMAREYMVAKKTNK